MVVVSVLGLCLLLAVAVPTARADFVFGTAVNMGSGINTGHGEFAPCLSADGLELYFDREESGNPPNLFVVRRATVDCEWGVPVKLGPPVNTSEPEHSPSISADGLSLYFTRGLGGMASRLYVTRRTTKDDDWGAPVSVGAAVNNYQSTAPCISADDLELYFGSTRPGGQGQTDLWVTKRATVNHAWGAPVNLGPTINTSAGEGFPGISPDGLLLFFTSDPDRPDGFGGDDMYVTRRATRDDAWGPPMNLGPIVNSAFMNQSPKFSFDGSMLYFHSNRGGGHGLMDIYQALILPVVDFNGDGVVDTKDLVKLIESWGQVDPLCDIAPFAWGDGVVDEQDLRVLMEWLMIPGPRALDVSCDVVLNWVAPSLAESQDVYFGTSLEAVSSAGRDNPQDVLVSQGQTGTMYIPQGPLDFSQTYYWRVDFVIPDLNPAICKGPILQFTTEPYAHLVTNVVASSNGISEADAGPENTVDGSGLDEADQHSVAAADMWLAKPPAEDALSIQFEFDRAYKLHEMLIWNYNSQFEPLLGFGLKDVTVEYSVDGDNWTVLGDVEVARATARPDYVANTVIDFDGIVTRFVRLTVNSGWGATGQYGLSEVRFLHIPVHARNPQPADGATDVAIDADLIWWPGRETQSHLLYFGTDADAVAAGAVPAIAQTAWTYTPEPLEFGTTYYWKVDQVDEAATYEGDLWCFTTQELEDCER